MARIEVTAPNDGRYSENLLRNFELVVDVYGASETNKTFENIVMLDSRGRIVRKGKPLDSEVEIVSASGQRRKVAETGLVRIRNPYMVRGYLQAPEATAKFFREDGVTPARSQCEKRES